MKSIRLFALGAAAGPVLALTSCSQIHAFSKATGGKLSEFSRSSLTAFHRLMPSRVPVVQVRYKELKDMPLGHERAIVYQEKQRNAWWFFNGPVIFKEPALPDASTEPTGSLLPAKPTSARE